MGKNIRHQYQFTRIFLSKLQIPKKNPYIKLKGCITLIRQMLSDRLANIRPASPNSFSIIMFLVEQMIFSSLKSRTNLPSLSLSALRLLNLATRSYSQFSQLLLISLKRSVLGIGFLGRMISTFCCVKPKKLDSQERQHAYSSVIIGGVQVGTSLILMISEINPEELTELDSSSYFLSSCNLYQVLVQLDLMTASCSSLSFSFPNIQNLLAILNLRFRAVISNLFSSTRYSQKSLSREKKLSFETLIRQRTILVLGIEKLTRSKRQLDLRIFLDLRSISGSSYYISQRLLKNQLRFQMMGYQFSISCSLQQSSECFMALQSFLMEDCGYSQKSQPSSI